MCSEEEILSSLNDLPCLANLFKENAQSILSDSIYSTLAHHFLGQSVTIEGLSVQRNLYGRNRSSLLNQSEVDLLFFNIKECLHSTNEQLIKVFLQYLHNIHRLLPLQFRDIGYLCSMIFIRKGNPNVIGCILCAYLEMNHSNENTRYDLIINGLYENEDENEDHPWVEQLKKRIIQYDKHWLRKFYLQKIYDKQFLNAVDTYDREKMFNIQPIMKNTEESSSSRMEKIELNLSSFDDLHSKLSSYVIETLPIETIKETSLIHLFSSSTEYPDDLHLLFSCLLISLLNPSHYNELDLRLFRCLIHLMNNYYINQQDLLDDNRYRQMMVYLLSKFLCEIHRRRSNSEHSWYRLYREIPVEHPLPTFDLFADLLCLLATLTYNHLDCQNQVRQIPGTIESILSMTQIDLNQPKSQACVAWMIKCLTEQNEDNRNYIKEIK